jgi:hypothetical protein
MKRSSHQTPGGARPQRPIHVELRPHRPLAPPPPPPPPAQQQQQPAPTSQPPTSPMARSSPMVSSAFDEREAGDEEPAEQLERRLANVRRSFGITRLQVLGLMSQILEREVDAARQQLTAPFGQPRTTAAPPDRPTDRPPDRAPDRPGGAWPSWGSGHDQGQAPDGRRGGG